MIDRKYEQELRGYEDAFSNVLALYYVLRNEGTTQPLKRAVLNQAGEVTAEAVDFMADVEVKVKRILTPDQYRRFMSLVAKERYEDVPPKYKQSIGLLFLRSNMNFDGDYRRLYWQAKNNRLQDREEPQHFPEEPVNAEDILNG